MNVTIVAELLNFQIKTIFLRHGYQVNLKVNLYILLKMFF